MNFVKKNLKWIITIIGVIIVTTGISVYATSTYLASQVEYNKNGQAKVSDALDDLYNKIPSGTKTITEKGSQIDVSKYQYADTTGLYTLSEVQSGKGTSWNNGNGTSTSTGLYSFDIKIINPSKIILILKDTGYENNCMNIINYFIKNSNDTYTRIHNGGSDNIYPNVMNNSIFSMDLGSGFANMDYEWVAIK